MATTARLNELAMQASRGSRASLALVIESVWPMLVRFAGQACRRHESIDDLIQEGVLGIMRAVKRYDPARGAFTTYLWYSLRTMYHSHHRRMAPLMTLPVNVTPTRRQHYIEVLKKINQARDASMLDKCGESPPEVVRDEDNPELLLKADRERFQEHLKTCSKRDRIVLLGRSQGLTLREIGDKMGRSKERIRQYEVAALRRAKSSLRSG